MAVKEPASIMERVERERDAAKWREEANQLNEIRRKVSEGLFIDSSWFSPVHLEAGSNWLLNSSNNHYRKEREKKVKALKIHCRR